MATFFDALGQYASNRMDRMSDRFNTATEYFTDPQEALRKRMEEEEEERKRREREEQLMREMEQRQRDIDQANTPVKTTTVTNPDGTQEVTIKGTPQALSDMNPNTPTITQPVVPSQTPGSPAVSTQDTEEEQRRRFEAEQARLRQSQQPPVSAPAVPAQPAPRMMPAVFQPGTQPAPQPAVAPTPVVAQAPTQPLVQQPPVEPRAVVPVTAPAPPPQAAQPVVQAPATAPATSPAPQAAPATTTAPAQIDFSSELSGLVSDPAKLATYYGDTSKDPAARKVALDLFKSHMEGTYSTEKATKTLEAAAMGDPKAQTEVMRDLKREDGSYIKAILFARLGLNQLAQEEQAKLGQQGVKIRSAIMDGKTYTVEEDSRGAILRAWDNSGTRQDSKTVSAINASGQKTGGQIFSATATSMVIPEGQPNAGEEYRQTFDSTTNKFKNIITTGPNAGQEYRGSAGIERRVTSQALIDWNKSLIDFARKPAIAGATKLMEKAVTADAGDGKEIERTQRMIERSLGADGLDTVLKDFPGVSRVPKGPSMVTRPAGTTSAEPVVPSRPAQPAAATTTTPAAAPAQAAPTAPVAPGTPGAGGRRPGESFDAYERRVALEKTQAEANIQERKELRVAEGKPPAEERGKVAAKDVKNQAYADSTYGLIRSISDEIKKSTGSGIGAGVDKVAGVLGKGTEGAQAIAKLEILSGPILANVPRFEGPQSDRDVEEYKRQAGDFANPKKPIAVRLAALDAMITILKKYDKEGKNDWSFGESKGQQGGGTTSSGNTYKRVQ